MDNSSVHSSRVLLEIWVHPFQPTEAIRDEFFRVEIQGVTWAALVFADIGQDGQGVIVG